MTDVPRRPARVPVLSAASDAVAVAEKVAIAVLAFGICALILLNVFTRAAGNALYWVDESAIYAMVWMAMIGASLTVRARAGVAVTLLLDALPDGRRWQLTVLLDAIVLIFGLLLIVLTWVWFDLPGLAAANFSILDYQAATFRFQYSEPTVTIGIGKMWLWLVMPLVAITITLHAAANLAENALLRSEYGVQPAHDTQE